MSIHYHSTSKRILSMAELNQSKQQSLKLSHHLRTLYHETGDAKYASMSQRVASCSTFWTGMYCPICGKYHQMHTTGCKHRLCPICAARASRVVAMQALEVMDYYKCVDRDFSCSLVTLTQQNVEGYDLSSTVDSMLAAWMRMRHLRAFERNVLGWARTIEIIPAKDGHLYHPHIHAIIMHHDLHELHYASWWSDAWRVCMNLPYNPIVDIRPISDLDSAVFEVSKYVSKLSRVYDGSPRECDHIRFIGDAMYNRQLRTYGGAWLKSRKILNMLRVEQMDDDAISEYAEIADDKCAVCDGKLVQVSLFWAGLTYMHDDIPVLGVSVGMLDNSGV